MQEKNSRTKLIKWVAIGVFLLILFGGSLFLSSKASEKKENALLQTSIDFLNSGNYEEAKDGFLYLQQAYQNPSASTLYTYAELIALWASPDLSDKHQVCLDINVLEDSYDGALADEIFAFKEEVLHLSPEIIQKYNAEQEQARKAAEQARKERIASGKPYVGMDSKYISQTILGPYDKTGYNEKREFDSKTGRHKEHRCTLYYWMDGSSCIFIARVQDDIGEVINVEDHPSGSYFGN